MSETSVAAPRRPPRRKRVELFIWLFYVVIIAIFGIRGVRLYQEAQEERAELEQRLIDRAYIARSKLDVELQKVAAVLGTMAQAPAAREGSVENLYPYAQRVREMLGALTIVMHDPEGRQLLNTLLPLMSLGLPQEPGPYFAEVLESVSARPVPVVSGLLCTREDRAKGYRCIAQRELVVISVPILRDERVVGILSATLTPERIAAMLTREWGRDMVGIVVDAQGRIIARSIGLQDYLGQAISLDFMQKSTTPTGTWRGPALTGRQIFAAYDRSPFSGWIVRISVLESELYRPLWRLYGLIALVAGFGLALLGYCMFLVKTIRTAAQEEERQREIAERERMRSREMSHRIKNNIAALEKILVDAVRTVEVAGKTPEEVKKEDEIRMRATLHSVVQAYDRLLREKEHHLRDLFLEELERYRERVTLAGTDALLERPVAFSVMLFVHELMVNAAKYGALKVPQGEISISWNTSRNMCFVVWTERGGPPQRSEPARKGFGTQVFEYIKAFKGGYHAEFLPEGLRMSFFFPIKQ